MEYNVGDKVTVFGGGYSSTVTRFQTVSRVTARKVILDDNTEWNQRGGDSWGAGSDRYARGPFIKLFKEEHQEQLRQQNIRNSFRNYRSKMEEIRLEELNIPQAISLAGAMKKVWEEYTVYLQKNQKPA